MKTPKFRSAFGPSLMWRAGGVAVIASMIVPLAGCGSNAATTPPPPVDAAPGQMAPRSAPAANQNQGMSTGTKLKILAGAAAAYYIYNKYKQSQAGKAADARNVQYYLSKSTGRVYYRDPNNNNQAVWVTPPPNQIPQQQVPVEQASQYEGWKGYEGAQTGKGLDSVFSTR